jgi:transcription initiation factor TFIIB
MNSRHISVQEFSGVSADEHKTTDSVDEQSRRCPDCEGRLVTTEHETYCRTCGRVVDDIELHTGPTSAGRKHLRNGQTEWGREPMTAFRVDGGLRTKIGHDTDANGNLFDDETERRLNRLRTQHRRFEDRNDRLTEALRDVEAVGTNLGVPHHVQVDAARLVRGAKRERLPCGRMAWEALAGGAVLLASRARMRAERVPSPERVARYTKAGLERTCAAARKVRLGLGKQGELPPARPRAVDAVLREAGEAFTPDTLLDVATVGRALLDVADRAGIGPGTSRVTMAASAVDRAMTILGRRPLTQDELVEHASQIVPTSKSRLGRYSRMIRDDLNARHPRATERPVVWAREYGRLSE